MVPKISETNAICKEVGRTIVLYEPAIITNVNSDGTRTATVAVDVYPDRTNKDVKTTMPWDVFTDKVYFDIKDLYDDIEEKGF